MHHARPFFLRSLNDHMAVHPTTDLHPAIHMVAHAIRRIIMLQYHRWSGVPSISVQRDTTGGAGLLRSMPNALATSLMRDHLAVA